MRWALASLSLTAVGCSQIGPATIANGRFDYNEAIVRSFDNQMLLNLVRLRYQDSILFLDLTSVVASYSRETRVGASSNVDVANSVNPTAVALGASGGVTWSESPTISYAPLQGEDFAKRLLAPIQPSSILLLSRSGWGLERLLVCTVQQLNELSNGTSIGGVAPRQVKHYQRFRRVSILLRELQEEGFIQINTLANQPELVAVTAGPTEMDEAAHRRADEILSLLNVTRPPMAGTPGPAKMAETPVPSPGTPRAPAEAPQAAPDTGRVPVALESAGFPRNPARIMLTGRSILGVMTFLAQQVEVPAEDLRLGLAHQALGPDGKAFDWNQISHGMFRVRSSDTRPDHAFLEVRYRGHWFYIDDRDLESKSTYTLLAQLFSLQSASGSMQAPLLTIPAR
ncbi:MAG TPA: hypothetical protein VJV79_33900 [Polyangiaceae bacterium]|nr:hypothetical protein [Polyangiaceae bacterium]